MRNRRNTETEKKQEKKDSKGEKDKTVQKQKAGKGTSLDQPTNL